jgi:hypothetical protein
LVVLLPTPLSKNPAHAAVIQRRASVALLAPVAVFLLLPLLMQWSKLPGKHPQHLSIDAIFRAAAGIKIFSLTLPMPPANAVAKAAVALPLPHPPPALPRTASLAEGEDKGNNQSPLFLSLLSSR